jgi:GTPase KRas protein
LQHFIETYDPTIEDSYRKKYVTDGQSSVLEVLDTAGLAEYTKLRAQWIREGEGFVLVYSVTSRKSFEQIKEFHQQIQQVKTPSMSAKESSVPIMLVGNKNDKQSERNVSLNEGLALARDLGCAFVETSARNADNVENAFSNIVHLLCQPKQQPPSQSDQREASFGSGRYHKGDLNNNLCHFFIRLFKGGHGLQRKTESEAHNSRGKQIRPKYIPMTW